MKTGLCEKCGKPAGAYYEIRNKRVYLVKFCKDCGRTSALVTKDAGKWLWKRQITDYAEPASSQCSMDCSKCNHHAVTPPYTVAIDVTNNCNQKCPICLAYVEAMGFTYQPPVSYFEKIYKHFEHADPKPNICFFGGEPTVHPQFPQIVKLAKDYGFQVQLFTNGIKLADESYCEKLCSMGIQVNLGFDGTRPDIYKQLRGDNSLAVKRRALANVIKYKANKIAVISTIASGVNDDNLVDILNLIHDHRDYISVWGFVPLTPCWDGTVNLEPTTTECVEAVFEKNIPDIEFVPTGMMKFDILSRFFGRQTLGGSHPNCESATLLVSDGKEYQPINTYLNKPLSELLISLRKLDVALTAKSKQVPQTGWKRKLFDITTLVQLVKAIASSIKFKEFFGNEMTNVPLTLIDLLKGKKIDSILKERTAFKNLLTLITIPYEDKGGLEDARLKDCPAVFAYEDVQSGEIRTAAFCSWQTVKDDVCRAIQEHYAEKIPGPIPIRKVSLAQSSK